ncbi:MAG TPA: hypothetical protein VE596_10675 [Gaiellaceae bacterium]|jgi:hypothetical protein|nr:hypothetical protein [Gaiellaceae bacterium]
MPPTPRRRSSAAQPRQARKPPHLNERVKFQTLLLENPNYFNTAPELGLPPKLELSGNTTYEELTCIGYNPALGQLEATVQIKLPTGYLGDLCSAGSFEYIRFFADFGGGWQDLGYTGFNVHDIPNSNDCAGRPTKPLTYVASLPWRPDERFCWWPLLPNVRAILSWQSIPPAGNPNFNQVWGNTLDRHVQIRPRPRIFVKELVDALAESSGATIAIPESLKHLEEIPVTPPGPPPPPELADLVQIYAAKAPEGKKAPAKAELVPEHRFGLADVLATTAPGAFGTDLVAAKIALWESLGLDFAKAVSVLESTSGDVTYEELDCLGLDYDREALVASFAIKRPTGYSGPLCTHGSTEYVAFWADWDDTCEWTYVATAQVQVHDFMPLPADGLHYAAFVAAPEIDQHRRRCQEPKIARIRAVLSWGTPPSTTDPEAIPYWGNRLDAHVQLRPGEPTDGVQPNILAIGGIRVEDIDTISGGTGMTRSVGLPVHFAHFPTLVDPLQRPCPFGGLVLIEGNFFLGYKYRVWVRRETDPPGVRTPLSSEFDVDSTHQTVDADGFFTYLDPSLHPLDRTLALWWSGGDDKWLVQLEIKDSTGTVTPGPEYTIQLDNTPPFVDVEITSPGGDCADFTQGTTVEGLFVARDAHFGSWGLATRPNTAAIPSNPPFADPPFPSTTETAPRVPPPPALPPWTGGHGWKLDTSSPVAMRPCGYVVEVSASDRSIVNSHPDLHNTRTTDTGLCVRRP